MSGTDATPAAAAGFPPPGALQPEPSRPSPWAASGPPPAGWGAPGAGRASDGVLPGGPPPGLLYGAAHKPGAVPLRPLRLGDVFDAAFKIVRFNPRATALPAVVMTSVAMVLPLAATAVIVFALGHTVDVYAADPFADATSLIGPWAALGFGLLLQMVGTILLTGMIAGVAQAAALGQRPTLAQAWAGTSGSRWRLIGLVALSFGATAVVWAVFLVGAALLLDRAPGVVAALWLVVGGLGATALCAFAWIRYGLLAAPALVIERLGVWASLGRAWRLSRGQFWRLLGITLLTGLVSQLAAGLLSTPLGIGGQVAGVLIGGGRYLMFFLVVGQVLGQVVSSAFSIPFNAGVTSLLYLDQRIRKEAYDVELMTAAGVTRG